MTVMPKPATDTLQPYPAWLRPIYLLVAATVTSTMAVVGAYANVKSDVRDLQTITAEQGRRTDKLERTVERIDGALSEIKGDVRYIRAKVDHP